MMPIAATSCLSLKPTHSIIMHAHLSFMYAFLLRFSVAEHKLNHVSWAWAGLLITEEVALRDAKLGALLRKAGVPAWSALATLLVEIRHAGANSTSPWAPYVAVLPNTCGCILEWPRNEVSDCICLTRYQSVYLRTRSQRLHCSGIEPVKQLLKQAHRQARSCRLQGMLYQTSRLAQALCALEPDVL